MLAAHRDQENLVSIHQANAVTKHQSQGPTRSTLQPKTPGNRYPKTPLRIPLNDENAVRAVGGKNVLANKTKADRSQWVTPAEPRTGRAVLGDKTTNAKARSQQQTVGKTPALNDFEKSQVRRPKSSGPKADPSKLQILQDTTFDPLSPSEPDTNLPPPEPLPYESDVWPDGVLTFDAIRPENRMKGYYEHYHGRRDENGMTRSDREAKAAQERRFREADARIWKDLDEDFTWNLGLLESPRKTQPIVPARDPEPMEKKPVRLGGTTRAPSTINSRRAASALGMSSRSTASALPRRPLATRQASSTSATSNSKLPSFMLPTMSKPRPATAAAAPRPKPALMAGLAASRSTLGYTKGRSVSSTVHGTGHVQSRFEAPHRGRDPVPIATVPVKERTLAKPEFVSIFDDPPREDDSSYNDNDHSLLGRNNNDGAVDDIGEDEGADESFRMELGL